MKRRIELYGRLRDAGRGSVVVVDLPDAATARQALSALKAVFGREAAVLEGCALAAGGELLPPAERLPRGGRLAVLPPVCGG